MMDGNSFSVADQSDQKADWIIHSIKLNCSTESLNNMQYCCIQRGIQVSMASMLILLLMPPSLYGAVDLVCPDRVASSDKTFKLTCSVRKGEALQMTFNNRSEDEIEIFNTAKVGEMFQKAEANITIFEDNQTRTVTVERAMDGSNNYTVVCTNVMTGKSDSCLIETECRPTVFLNITVTQYHDRLDLTLNNLTNGITTIAIKSQNTGIISIGNITFKNATFRDLPIGAVYDITVAVSGCPANTYPMEVYYVGGAPDDLEECNVEIDLSKKTMNLGGIIHKTAPLVDRVEISFDNDTIAAPTTTPTTILPNSTVWEYRTTIDSLVDSLVVMVTPTNSYGKGKPLTKHIGLRVSMTLNYTTSWMLCVKGISEPLSHYEVYYNETTSFNDTFIPTDNNCVMITAIGCNITGSNANTPVQVVVRINTTTALTYTAVISTNDTCIPRSSDMHSSSVTTSSNLLWFIVCAVLSSLCWQL